MARHTQPMQFTDAQLSETEERALALDGLSAIHGSMVWPSPQPALLADRARLVAEKIPPWAIAAGITAGWVWTGIGRAEPWTLLVATSPSPSPMARQEWKPRQLRREHAPVQHIHTLSLLSREQTFGDLLIVSASDEVAAAQLYLLGDRAMLQHRLSALKNLRPKTLDAARRRAALVEQWWAAYPLVTR